MRVEPIRAKRELTRKLLEGNSRCGLHLKYNFIMDIIDRSIMVKFTEAQV